jgi:DNA-binding NtrC family response regulator
MARLLVVDDDAQMRRMIDIGFSRKGHVVVPVPELAQAQERIEQEDFDLVILDLEMRGEHGSAFLEGIRKARCDIPIVIYSGAVTVEMEKILRKAGANEVFHKDTEINKLVEQAEKVLKARDRLFNESAQDVTLLVVEGDPTVRDLVKTFFENKHYTVFEADSGQRAIEIAQAESVSCALVELGMPGIGGLELLPKLLEINPNMGIVMISENEDHQTIQKAIDLGAYGYVLKPFDFVYLELTVASRLTIASSN